MQCRLLKIIVQTILCLLCTSSLHTFAQSTPQTSTQALQNTIQANFKKLSKTQDQKALETLLRKQRALLRKLDSASFQKQLIKFQEIGSNRKNRKRYLAINQAIAQSLAQRRKVNPGTEAIAKLEMLATEAQEWDMLHWEGKLYTTIGKIYQQNNLYPEAFSSYIKAKASFEKLGSQAEKANVLYHIASNLYDDQSYEESIEYFKQVIAHATEETDARQVINSLNSVGLLKRKIGDTDSARFYLKKALIQAENHKDTAWIGIVNGNMGTLYMLKGDFKEAEKRYLIDINTSHKYEQWGSKANALTSLADIYLQQRRYEEAKQYLDSSLYVCTQYYPLPVSRMRTYEGLAKLYGATQRFELAHEYLSLYTKLNDSIQGKSHENQLKKMKLVQQFREAKRQQERSKENQLQELKAFRSKTFQVLLFSLLMVALVILTLLYRNLQTKKKANQQLAFQQQEILQQNQRLQQQQEEILTQNETIEQKSQLLTEQYEEILRHQTLLTAQNNHLEQAYQNVRLLTNIGQHITSSLDLNEILHTIYTHVNQLMDASNFGIGLYDPQHEQITFELTMVDDKPLEAYTRDMNDKNQLAVWCIEHGQPIIIGDFAQEYHKYLGKSVKDSEVLSNYQPVLTPRSIIYIPLIVQQKIKGVLSILSKQKNAYTNQHFDLLKSLSVYVAIAIENAQGYKELVAQKESIDQQNNLISLLLNENQHRIGNDFVAVYAKIAAIDHTHSQANAQELVDSAKERIREAMELQNLLQYHFHGSNQTLEQPEIQEKLQTIVHTLYRIHFQENTTHKINVQSEVKSLDKNRFVLIGFCVFELIKNICKHAFKNKPTAHPVMIDLSLQESKKTITLSIKSNGEGFKPDLFDTQGDFKFNQHKITKGLSIVSSIIDREGGSFKIYTEGVHSQIKEGSTFTCVFE
ncbi:hypothetical protein BKI52_34450 [marine bacterium AO1-C]|nr:hypothetical protein BKI52_34450 [marine bacterium AO1-C]